ncbi:DUF6387 family protein [Rosenbergiella nectarea]|uniref:DUF6387 family protein n=1 Tax=Rosenbergiella nectarea TaxID=988801 RepID=UPI001F4D82FB|nr:DUF6387 family protein [Rosenbergiella nectarea]
MKNWTTDHTKEIKEWFSVGNYEIFEDLSLKAYYHELWARAIWHRPWPTEEEGRDLIQFGIKVFGGNPVLYNADQLQYTDRDDLLYEPPHIHLTTTKRIAQLGINSMVAGLFAWDGGQQYKIIPEYSDSFISEIFKDSMTKNTVMLEIDLASGTDEEIAESIRTALPQWRKIKATEPDMSSVVRFGYGTIKKMISYRIIAMLDILMWSKIHKVRVSDDRLSRLLYTDDDNEDETRLNHHIRDSDRPLAIKAATINFIRQFNYFLNKNPHLKDMKVSDVMKLND